MSKQPCVRLCSLCMAAALSLCGSIAHHVHDGEHVGGNVLSAVLLQHLLVSHHQSLNIQTPHLVGWDGRAFGSAWLLKLIRHDEKILVGRLGSICRERESKQGRKCIDIDKVEEEKKEKRDKERKEDGEKEKEGERRQSGSLESGSCNISSLFLA